MTTKSEAKPTIAPELEEGGQSSGTLMAHTEGAAALAAIQRTQNIVLEQTRHAIVCESLRQLDYGHQPGRNGQVLGDMAEGSLLVVVGLFAVGREGQGLLIHVHRRLVVRYRDLLLLDGGFIVAMRSGVGSVGQFHVLLVNAHWSHTGQSQPRAPRSTWQAPSCLFFPSGGEHRKKKKRRAEKSRDWAKPLYRQAFFPYYPVAEVPVGGSVCLIGARAEKEKARGTRGKGTRS